MTNIPDDNTLNNLLSKIKAKVFTTKNGAFLGSLLCSVEQKWDDNIPTACTNGKWIKWNREFFYNLPVSTRLTIMLHELWHVGFMHMSRVKDRNLLIWTQAADYAINNLLDYEGYSWDGNFLNGLPLKGNIYLDHQYDDMSTEEIYELLDKKYDGSGDSLPEELQDIIEANAKEIADVMGNVVAATQAHQRNKNAGKLPGEIEHILDQFLNPQLPWETILAQFFNDLCSYDYSYRNPNRRYQDNDFLSPSLEGRNGMDHICYYVDVSGSISDDEIKLFNSEVKYIKDVINPKLLTLVLFDTRIQKEYQFTDDDPFETIVVTGRGGTDLEPVEEHIRKHRPDAAVIFSDLYVAPMNDPGIPVIWAVVNSDIVPNFGTHLKLKT